MVIRSQGGSRSAQSAPKATYFKRAITAKTKISAQSALLKRSSGHLTPVNFERITGSAPAPAAKAFRELLGARF